MRKEFEVVGSEGEVYTVTFSDETGSFKAFCTCRAGVNRVLCKHVKNLMNSDPEVMASFEKSELKAMFDELDTKIEEMGSLKRETDKLKKAIANKMLK